MLKVLEPFLCKSRCSAKKVFLEFSQKSQEDTCNRASFLITLQTSACCRRRCFSMTFANFLRIPFLTEYLWWLSVFTFLIFKEFHISISRSSRLQMFLKKVLLKSCSPVKSDKFLITTFLKSGSHVPKKIVLLDSMKGL